MKYHSELIPGVLVKRYKRFLADVKLENGRTITAHTANTGTMLTCSSPGARVMLSDHAGEPVEHITTASSVAVVVEFSVGQQYRDLQLSVGLLDFSGDEIFVSAPQDVGLSPPNEVGQYRAIVRFPAEILMGKMYGIRVVLWRRHGGVIDMMDNLQFSVQEGDSLFDARGGGRSGGHSPLRPR